MLAAIAVGNRTRLPEAPLGDPGAAGGAPPRKGLRDLVAIARLRLRLAVTMFAWLTCSVVRSHSRSHLQWHYRPI